MKNSFISLLDSITRLIDVKTIISFALIGAVIWGFFQDMIHAEYVTALASSVITYFFTKSHYEKNGHP